LKNQNGAHLYVATASKGFDVEPAAAVGDKKIKTSLLTSKQKKDAPPAQAARSF
jgi:hypothetical protein